MDPFAPHLSAGHFRPEAYVAPDLPSRPAGAKPIPGSAREVDRDRPPTQPAHGETTAELGFADLLDVINPLQHIPVVGELYRELTEDQIAAPARIAGGAIFGGPLGFVSGLVNAIFVDAAGQNLGEAVLATVFGEDGAEPESALAAAPDAAPTAVRQVVAAAPQYPDMGQSQQPLTGAAALRALGADLRLAEQSPTPPAAFRPVAIDARQLVSPPRPVFSDRMLEGLNKYNVLVTEKNAPPTLPATSVETDL